MNSFRSSFNVTFSKRWFCDSHTTSFLHSNVRFRRNYSQGVEYVLNSAQQRWHWFSIASCISYQWAHPLRIKRRSKPICSRNKLWRAKITHIPTWWYWLAITRQGIFDKSFIHLSFFFYLISACMHVVLLFR